MTGFSVLYFCLCSQMVQLHSRVQVVDVQAEEIKYTPKDGETITRTVTHTDGQTTTETLQIPSGRIRQISVLNKSL